MGTVLAESDTVENSQHDPSVPDVSLLEDKFPEWFWTPPSMAGFTLLIAAVFVFFSLLMPLYHTDMWGHLAYGRFIWETGALPATEPLLPLSRGVTWINTAWLSQVVGFGATELAGKAALSFLYAGSVTLCFALVVHRIFCRTGSLLLAPLGGALLLWLEWQQFQIARPQLAGLALFCGLLSILLSRTWRRAYWFAIPAGFALWANLHGSFLVGLGLLGCFLVGRSIDVLRRTGRLSAIWRDRLVRRWLLLTELSAAAVLVNPYGLALYVEVLGFGNNANLGALVEWRPLNIRMLQGQAMAAVSLLMIITSRISPRRVTATEVLLLFGLGISSLWYSRMLLWWAPAAVCFWGMHAAAWLRQWSNSEAQEPARRGSIWSIVSIGIMFIAFEMSALGGVAIAPLTGSDVNKRMDQVAVSGMTPVGAADYLNEHPPTGLVFNTYEFGDYLLWAGPRDIQLFVDSHAHLVPEEVWDDYLGIINQNSGWAEMFDRYGVDTIVLDTANRNEMINNLRMNEGWRRVYHDDRSAVFKRYTGGTANSGSSAH